MASLRCVQVLFVVVVALVAAEDVRYDGYQLWRTVPQHNYHVDMLTILKRDPQLDFWIEPSAPGHPVDIFVSPDKITTVDSYLAVIGLRVEVVINNTQTLVAGNRMARLGSGLDWENYHTIETINAWLKEVAQQFNNIATIITAGTSTEGRELTGLRIAHKPNLPIVFVEAGIHAREWITPATATWFIQQALNSSASDLIKSYEWHVFPSVNPDGYAFTQTNRLWRKTRSKQTSSCIGTDANRNWPYQWKSTIGGPCSETYPGPVPASEPETKGLINYLKSIASRTRVYIGLHSYSQLLMYPWGYTTTRPDNDKRFNEVAAKAVTKLATRYGTRYRFGPIASTIYVAPGNTIDFAYSLKIPFPFVFELRDTGNYGFLLPKEQIIPTATETFDAVTVILEEAKK